MEGEECRKLEARIKRRQACLLGVILEVSGKGTRESSRSGSFAMSMRGVPSAFSADRHSTGTGNSLSPVTSRYLSSTMDDVTTGDDETYLLLLLADGNLPTGSFVASSGLESFVTHGFFGASTDGLDNTMNFIRDSVATYARSALPFVADVHQVVTKGVVDRGTDDLVAHLDRVYEEIKALDDLYETMTLNHVAKRASKSQGVALLTLYTKGFSPPTSLSMKKTTARDAFVGKLVDSYKLKIRREEVQGHLPVCWGISTAALNISLGESLAFEVPSWHTYLRLDAGRSIAVSSPLPPRKEPPLRSREAEYDWAICVPAAPVACRPSHRGYGV